MVTVNPDPHAKGYRFSPHRYVTAVFRSREELGAVIEDLNDASFEDEEIEVFVGDEGVEKLDVAGKKHGVVVRLLRNLEEFFTDATDHLERTDDALRHGGCAVDVFTAGDPEKKARAARIMKTHHAHEVFYWGRWIIEKL
jgi:hypothetical protein